MADNASLEIRVRSLEVELADRRLQGLEKTGKRTERATDGLTRGFTRMVAPLTAMVSAVGGLQKLVSVTREFDVLNAGLITATKSAEGASVAFEALSDFAANTPYELNQAVDGFNKLVNLGLTPSERALVSYGNTASAMGKDLSQMIEAVADASTMEFERLKEFGIKARQEGDNISFTFQGVTTTVRKNAAEIEQYLMAIGENQFAGAMEQRMNSLDGAMSNMGDSWNSLFREISQSGVGDLIESNVRTATSAIEDLTDAVASGQLMAGLTANLERWDAWADDIEFTIKYVTQSLEQDSSAWAKAANWAVDLMVEAFSNFPENVRAFIQLMTVEVAAGFDKAAALGQAFKDSIKAIFNDDTQASVQARYEADLARIDGVRQDMIGTILQERDTALQAYEEKMAASQKLREEYEKEREERRKGGGDRLAQFGLGAAAPGEGSGVSKASEAAQKKRRDEFDKLVESLLTEEEAIQRSYDRRAAIIEANTQQGSEARRNLMERLEEDRQKELDHLMGVEDMYARRQRLAAAVAAVEQEGWNESQRAAARYQEQIETLWEAQMVGVISQKQHEEMVNQVTEAYDKQQDKITGTFLDLDELGKQAARNVQDAFADFLFDPFDQGLEGMLLGFVNVVRRMAAEAAAAQLAGALFGGSSGGSGLLGAVVGGIGSFFGGGAATGATAAGYANVAGFVPGRAAGGPTSPGQLYEVNERGTELFSQGGKDYLLSTSAGNVKPLKETSQEGSINLTMVFQVDNSGTEVSSTGTGGGGMEQFMNTMKQVSMQTIQSEMRPGGLLWKIKEGRA